MNGHWVGWAGRNGERDEKITMRFFYAAQWKNHFRWVLMNKKGKHWARLKCSMNFCNAKELDIYDIAKNLFELNQFLIARLSGNLCKIPFDSLAFDGKFIWEICEKKDTTESFTWMNTKLVNPQRKFHELLKINKKNHQWRRFSSFWKGFETVGGFESFFNLNFDFEDFSNFLRSSGLKKISSKIKSSQKTVWTFFQDYVQFWYDFHRFFIDFVKIFIEF